MSLLAKPAKSLWHTTSIVGIITLISRVLGFVRDMILAHAFGPQAGLDAFLVAYKLPNLCRDVFAEGTFSQAIMPILAELQLTHSKPKLRAFIGQIAGTMMLILGVMSALVIVAGPLIITLCAPGFSQDPERHALAVSMLRIIFPYIIFISMTALSAAVLNAFGSFAIPAFASVMLNVTMIIAALGFSAVCDPPVMVLAWGILIAGSLQLIWHIPSLWRLGLLCRPVIAWSTPLVQRVIKQIIPALYALSAQQIHFFISTIFASFLWVGSISWLYFSVQLAFFPLGLFALTITTVLMPQLSSQVAKGDELGFQRTIDWGIKFILLLAVPSMVGFCCLAKPLITTLFHYGQFSVHDVRMTAPALIAYAVGLPAMMLVRVLTAVCYSRGAYRLPVRISVFATGLNILFNALLVLPMQHVGLALATSLAAICQVLHLSYQMINQGVVEVPRYLGRFLFQLVVANLVLAACLWWFAPAPMQWFAWSALVRVEQLAGVMSLAALIYFGCLWLLGLNFKTLMSRQ